MDLFLNRLKKVRCSTFVSVSALSFIFASTLANAGSFDSLNEAINTQLEVKSKSLTKTKPGQKAISSEVNAKFILKLESGAGLESFSKQLSASDLASELKVRKSFKTAKGRTIVLLESKEKGLSTSSISTMTSALATISNVDVVEQDLPISHFTNDTDYDALWGLNNTGQTGGTNDADIDAPEAWSVTTGSSGVIVGVIDTGIDYNHPDLVGNIWQNLEEITGSPGVDDDGNGHIDDLYGIDSVNGDSDPMDDNGHGTHVSGTIGATGNNEEGIVGVNHHVQIAGCKFLDEEGYGSTSGAIECIEYFTALKLSGENVVATNNSWGQRSSSIGLQQEDILLKESIDTAGEAGIVFVAAAGNDSLDSDVSPSYPASFDSESIISVASTDHNDELSYFSNYGVTTTDIAAPGSNILSTVVSPIEFTCSTNQSDIVWSEDFDVTTFSSWDREAYDTSVTNPRNASRLWWAKSSDTETSSGSSIDDSEDGSYSNNLRTIVALKNSLDLSDITGTACFRFSLKGYNEDFYDFLHVAASSDNGENWTILESFDESYSSFESLSVGIPDRFKSSQFKLALVRTSDYSVTYSGYIVDDLSISEGGRSSITGNYDTYSGTSMAAPHVTGAVALAASVLPEESVTERVNRVLNNVDVVGSLSDKVSTSGRLNVSKMVEGLSVDIVGLADSVDVNQNWMAVDVASTDFNKRPVIILGPPSYNHSSPVITRLRRVNKSGFEVKLQEWDYQNGAHVRENVSFLALEPGVYIYPDGSVLEVGSLPVSGGKSDFTSHSFEADFPGIPEVLTTIQSYKDSQPVTVRVNSLTKNSFSMSLNEEDAAEGDHAVERVGFIAFYAYGAESPILSLNGSEYEADWVRKNLSHSWSRALSKEFALQEEQSDDDETTHRKERTSFLRIISESGQKLYFAQDVSGIGDDTVAIRKR